MALPLSALFSLSLSPPSVSAPVQYGSRALSPIPYQPSGSVHSVARTSGVRLSLSWAYDDSGPTDRESASSDWVRSSTVRITTTRLDKPPERPEPCPATDAEKAQHWLRSTQSSTVEAVEDRKKQARRTQRSRLPKSYSTAEDRAKQQVLDRLPEHRSNQPQQQQVADDGLRHGVPEALHRGA